MVAHEAHVCGRTGFINEPASVVAFVVIDGIHEVGLDLCAAHCRIPVEVVRYQPLVT